MAEKSDIMSHYDDDFNFYKPILGGTLAYSCADWQSAQSLDHAQEAKFSKMLAFAGISSDTPSFVDLGCGWGSLLRYASERRVGGSATGITISPGQAHFCREHLAGYRVNIIEDDIFNILKEADGTFQYDAAVSIGAFEHFANPRHFKNGTHIDRYREFFRGVSRLVSGNLSLQTIVTLKRQQDFSPEERKKAFRLYYFLSKHIFPNSLTPPLEDVIHSIQGIYEIEQQETNSTDYEKTLDQWSENLDRVRDEIDEEVYLRFKKYFDLTSEQYKKGALAIARFSLKPIR